MNAMESVYRNLLDNLYDGAYFVDRDRRITYWNRAAERMTGFAAAEVVGKKCADNILKHVDSYGTELCHVDCALAKTLEDGCNREAELFLHHRDGHRMPVAVRVLPVTDGDGGITGAVELFTDVSSQSALMARIAELEALALLDPMTRLGNRRYLEINLQGRLDELRRYGIRFGLLFFDIDHFKAVNDGYGHEIGDRVLTMVANTLTASSRPFDVYGRWGGEEFIALIPNVDLKGLETVAQRLRLLVRNSFLVIEDEALHVSVSVGGTIAAGDDCMESLVGRADRLMYKSKQEGRDRVSLG